MEQVKGALAILGFDHGQYRLISVTSSIPAIVIQARRYIHDAELKVIHRIQGRLGDALYLLKNSFLVDRVVQQVPLNWDRQNDFTFLLQYCDHSMRPIHLIFLPMNVEKQNQIWREK